jgi:hypothetical protein
MNIDTGSLVKYGMPFITERQGAHFAAWSPASPGWLAALAASEDCPACKHNGQQAVPIKTKARMSPRR